VDLEATNGKLQQDKVDLEAKNGKLQQDKADLEAKNSKLQQEKGYLEAKNGKLQQDKVDLEATNGKLQKDKGYLEAKSGKLQQIVMNLKHKFQQENREAAMQQHVVDLEAEGKRQHHEMWQCLTSFQAHQQRVEAFFPALWVWRKFVE